MSAFPDFLCTVVLAQAEQRENPIVRFFLKEFYISWPMLAMSLTGIMFVIWRLLLNINGNTNMDEFLPVFQEKLEREGLDGALRFCRTRTDIIPRRLYVAGLETSKQGTAAMRRAMANAIELEILPDLNFLLPTILAIAKIATMVGLLGTVISMINTFQAIEASKEAADARGYSGQVGLALFATAMGLVTAIPLVFSHVLFRAWASHFEVRMKSAAQKLLVLVQAKSAAGTLTKPAPAAPVKTGADSSGVSPRR